MKRKPITNMRLERVKKDLSQREVAEYMGTSQQYYLMIELLQKSPSETRAKQLEEYFEKDIDYLLSLAE